MKLFLLSLPLLAAALSSCSRSAASPQAEQPPENGAQFVKDHGLALTDEMKQVIGLKIVEVGEEAVAPAFSVTLHAMGDGMLGGWITDAQGALLKPGVAVELPGGSGTLRGLERTALGALGDWEVTVATEQAWAKGAEVKATFRTPAGDATASIPRSALLKTAEGTFAYAVNGPHYLRTPVKVGAMNEQTVEITDGLYAGDEVVASPVMSLWMAELQVLRGGKACTCGH